MAFGYHMFLTKKYLLSFILIIFSCSSNSIQIQNSPTKREIFKLKTTANHLPLVKTRLKSAKEVQVSVLKIKKTLQSPASIAFDKTGKLYTMLLTRGDLLYQIDIVTGEVKEFPSAGYRLEILPKRPQDIGFGYLAEVFYSPPFIVDSDNRFLIALTSQAASSTSISKQIRYLNLAQADDPHFISPNEVEIQTPVLEIEDFPKQVVTAFGIAIANNGIIYLTDFNNNCIHKIENGKMSIFSGSSIQERGKKDGKNLNALFSGPLNIAIGSHGDLYVTDLRNASIRKITPEGEVTTVLNQEIMDKVYKGTKNHKSLGRPYGLVVDKEDNLYITLPNQSRIIKMLADRKQVIDLLGSPSNGCLPEETCTGENSTFSFPASLALDQNGDLYVADIRSNLIRKISSLEK